jgi:hypothetical protein
MLDPDNSPMSDKEKIQYLMDALAQLRDSLDESIAFIDDTHIEIDPKG